MIYRIATALLAFALITTAAAQEFDITQIRNYFLIEGGWGYAEACPSALAEYKAACAHMDVSAEIARLSIDTTVLGASDAHTLRAWEKSDAGVFNTAIGLDFDSRPLLVYVLPQEDFKVKVYFIWLEAE